MTVLGVSLIAGVASYVPAAEAKAYSRPAPTPQQTDPVKGAEFAGKNDLRAEKSPGTPADVKAPTWPAATSGVVNLAPVIGAAGQPKTVSTPQRVGTSPVTVAPAANPAKTGAAVNAVRVDVLGQDRAEQLGVSAVVLRVGATQKTVAAGKVRLQVKYSDFKNAYGGDWATRLRMVRLDCSNATTCSKATIVPGSTLDAKSETVSADVDVPANQSGSAVAAFAVAAAADGPNGAYSATTLSPASTWSIGKQTGDFNWSYPLRVPPGTAGPRPELSIGYSSGSLDGQTASTNNQGSWLGQGHTLEPGYVERKYVSCADDMTAASNNKTKTGDLCWRSDNATLSLGSHSSELLYDPVKGWKLQKDDGSRIERLSGADNDVVNGPVSGEHWRLTTTDGTQYFFGLNPAAYGASRSNSVSMVPVYGNNAGESCYKAGDFAGSQCALPWRWNVDRVIDTSGNVMTYRYAKETNYYGRNNNTAVSSYDRGSYLTSIEYGERNGTDASVAAPARVVFEVAERCFPSGAVTCAPEQLTAANASKWPDVPFDQICASATTCPGKTSPAFFSRKRLDAVYTGVHTGGGNYRTVDRWDFGQEFKDPGDGTSAGLWLASVTHSGMANGTAVVDPPVTFEGTQMPNRVGDFTGGAFPMNKPRVNGIRTESGALISVNYSAKDCTTNPAEATAPTNTRRCFPVYWTREGGENPTLHWFHKYIVTRTVETDLVGDSPTKDTAYSYAGSAGWHFDDNELTALKYRTWGDWRGYNYVTVLEGPAGSQTSTKYLYFRGLHGDRLNKEGTQTKTVKVTDSQSTTGYDDFDRLNGYVREQVTYNGAGGAEITGTVNTPWLKQTGASPGDIATLLGTGYVRLRTRLTNGTYRVSGTDSQFDDQLGLPTSVSDLGDVSKGDDDRCVRYEYAQRPSGWVMDTVKRKETASVSCALADPIPSQIVADERTYYDQHTSIDTEPLRGLVSKVETMSAFRGAPVYEQRARMVYDELGRTTETYDGLNRRTSSVEYVPATGGPVTGTKTTDALNNTSESTLDPAWGSPTVEIDANGKRTDLTYDGSGRLTSVWLPDRPKADGKSASAVFSYLLSKTAGQPNIVSSQELLPNGTYSNTRTLFDGLLRERQTQAPSANGNGRVITDTKYSFRGVVEKKGGPYFDDSSGPSNKIFQVTDVQIPTQTVYTVDGANRVTVETMKSKNSELWRTTTSYGGNFVGVDPPVGQTATMSVVDTRGNTVELRQYPSGAVQGPSDNTVYTYTPRDELASVKNAGGSTWSYTYDLRGRQISSTDPDKGTTTSTYDDVDRLTSTRDARDQSLFFEYDNLDRKTAVRSGSATGTVLSSWAYDTLGKGLLTSSTRTVGGNKYVSAITGYDALNRPTGTKVTIPAVEGKLAGEYTSSTKYNPDGSVDEVTMPQVPGLPNETVETIYSPSGNLTAIGGWSSYLTGAKYTPFGEPTLYTMGDVLNGKGAFQTFGYDEGTHRLEWMKVDRETQAKTDDSFDYTYDAGGNILAIAHSQAQGASMDRQCFAYDFLRRLTEARTTSNASCTTAPTTGNLGSTYPYWKTYGYWKSGNRAVETSHAAAGNTVRNYAYPAGSLPRPHAVTGVTSSGPGGTSADSYTYDATGNMATRTESGDTDTFTWDVDGSLKSVAGPSGTTDFVYDGEGDRLIKHDPTGATLYLGDTEVRLDKAADTVSSTRYYKFNGSTVAMRTDANNVVNLFADHHGTATVSIDRTTSDLSRRWMDPFGTPRGETSTWKSKSRGFVDGQLDPSTRLTHLGDREYDPDLGRFISVDSVVDRTNPQQMNAYSYATNSPVSMSDPDGLAVVVDLPSGGKVATKSENESEVYNDDKKSVERWNSTSYEEKVHHEIERQISYHTAQKAKAKETVKRVIRDLVKIVADELGVTDALDCFKNGDISSCVSTGITVLSSFAGGVAGKMLSKYGAPWKWKKAAELVGRIKELAGEAIAAIRKLGSCNSFVPGTPVVLASGASAAIETVNVGDSIVATDPATGKTAAQKVVATIIGDGQKELVDLDVHFAMPSGESSEVSIVTTSGHHFSLQGGGRWVTAGQLKVGDELHGLRPGQRAIVKAVGSRVEATKVHNLTVAVAHTYYVGRLSNSVLVHNDACKIGGRYKELTPSGDDMELHHMPANSVSPLTHGNGPSIRMEKLDHRQTASWGSRTSAKNYRNSQKKLIDEGRFDDAIQMDIDDIQGNFGSKYDPHILEMIDSLD
ncbi:polymorphic toxin-type HINT domain-containing protein [Kribbella sp. DT2]|uniref:polymorphic toxin-type HINT domain-containing protein n=1 Tax=Kribbella sp. DT2 TaxID=3393427 RepID=UPI003CF3FBEF